MDKPNFGEYLRTKRKEEGFTLKKLGSKIGISHSYLSQIENGERGIPSLDNLYKIGSVLELDTYELLEIAGFYDEIKRMQKNDLSHLIRSGAKEKLLSNKEFIVDIMKTVNSFKDEHLKDFNGICFLFDEGEMSDEHNFFASLYSYLNAIDNIQLREEFIDKIHNVVGRHDELYLDGARFEVMAEQMLTPDLFQDYFFRIALRDELIAYANSNEQILIIFGCEAENIGVLDEVRWKRGDNLSYLHRCVSTIYDCTLELKQREKLLRIIKNTVEEFRNPSTGEREGLDLSTIDKMPKVLFKGKILSTEEITKVQEIINVILN